MAAPYGPDVVGLLRDRTSYGVIGDHGGYQQEIQRIPMILTGPGVEPGARPKEEARLVDLLPTILDLVDEPQDRGGSFVAAFSARGATKAGIMEAAKEDHRERIRNLWALRSNATEEKHSA